MEKCINNNHNGNGVIEPDGGALFQLLGYCKRLVADGVVNKMEADLLKHWLAAHRVVPASGHVVRADFLVSRIISDGKLSRDERRELFNILDQELI